MKILVDTNILISAVLFPTSRVSKTLIDIAENHHMVLCDQNIAELREVIKRKKPELQDEAEKLIAELSYELVPAVKQLGQEKIRDRKDQPILNAAILNDVDIILTGDKDFLSMEMDRPKCMNVKSYLEGL